MRRSHARHLQRDFLVLCGSVVVAVLLVRLGILDAFFQATAGMKMLASLLAGVFFTSILTVAPATVALVALGETFSPLAVAFWAACGAVVIDVLILRFVEPQAAADFQSVFSLQFRRRIGSLFHVGFLKWLAILAGAFLVASPLPDEAGLVLLGISRTPVRVLLPLLFVLHFGGIFALVSIGGVLI